MPRSLRALARPPRHRLERLEGRDLIGRRLGPYDIQGVLGAGGMGEVYRARDTRLGRDVALKILPELLANDPDRLARFEREAQVLASLNHPHIGAIYGVEESGTVRALVLELVEGPTLADRIAQGPLSLAEAVSIARQIAEALEAAHERGVIHRDLKPANVKLRPDGTVKVLDFGLAKVLEVSAHSGDVDQAPTVAGPAPTEMGVILGTAPYMSPEQAAGRAVDKRTDVWAFGCVLFEMLTAQRAFQGQDVADTLAIILTQEPDWSQLPPATPVPIRRVLRRCLEKDRRRRLADVADARLDLEEHLSDAKPASLAGAPPLSRPALRRALPWAIAACCAVTALALVGLRVRERPPVAPALYRTSLVLPGSLPDDRPALALSPDGRRLAFVATDAAGRSQLWVRSLDGLAAQAVADTEEAHSPFWSPDGRWLAFIQGAKLRKVEAAGGRAITLFESAGTGGAWSRDDVILFTQEDGALAQIRAAGGTATPVTETGSQGAELVSYSPAFLPDGRHFVYVELNFSDTAKLYLASLDDPAQRTALSVSATAVQYAQGFLWFLQGSTLMAQPFDADRRVPGGEAVPVAEQVMVTRSFDRGGVFSVSPGGNLVLQTDPAPGNELAWYDRHGQPLGTLGSRADYDSPVLSPDGRRLVVTVAAGNPPSPDLWIFDVTRGIRTRLTFDDSRPIGGAVWSPDGDRIAFATRRDGQVAIVQRPVSGAGRDEVLLQDESEKELNSWSPDGRFLLYTTRSGGDPTPWVLPLDGDRHPTPWAQTRAFFSEVSPAGGWAVYMSQESGRFEVYVTPFPGPGGSLQVSPAGGFDPIWRADGKEILYLGPDEQLMSAALAFDGDQPAVGEVKPLFRLPKIAPRGSYDISPDGSRIVAVARPAQATAVPLTLIVNWPALLRE